MNSLLHNLKRMVCLDEFLHLSETPFFSFQKSVHNYRVDNVSMTLVQKKNRG